MEGGPLCGRFLDKFKDVLDPQIHRTKLRGGWEDEMPVDPVDAAEREERLRELDDDDESRHLPPHGHGYESQPWDEDN